MIPNTAQLAALFEMADVGWVFNESTFGENPADTADRILQEMDLVDRVLHAKIGRPSKPSLVEDIFSDSTRLKPLIQAFASPVTAEIRAMAYCVLSGAEVFSIRLDYESKVRLELRIVVAYESGQTAEFCSEDVWDFEALRHFGMMKLGTLPVIDGYYAFRKAAD